MSDALHRCVHCQSYSMVYSCLDNDVANKPHEVNLRCMHCGSVFDVEYALEEMGYYETHDKPEDAKFWKQFE